MAVGALVGRVTGFGRTAVIGAALGAGLVGDAYATAVMLPGILYEVLLGGTLAGILVPLLVRARESDADRGEAYLQRLLTLAVVVFAGATALLAAMTPFVVGLLTTEATSPAARDLLASLTYLLVPTVFCYGLGAVLAAAVNSRDHFATPTWAPVANNLTLIAIGLVFLTLPGQSTLTPETITVTQVVVLGGGTLLGVAVQAYTLWFVARRLGVRWRWRFDFRALRLTQLAGLLGWTLLYLAVSQVAVFLILALAKSAGDRGSAGPFVYGNGWLLLMMGYGIAALPIIIALVPRMGSSRSTADPTALDHNVRLGSRLITVVGVPVSLGLAILGEPLAVVLFEWHRYTHEQALDSGLVIAVAGLGLLPYALSQLQVFAFYAVSDARTPALLNIPVTALRVALVLALYAAVPVRYAVPALMAGNVVAFAAAAVLGHRLLRRRLGRHAGDAAGPYRRVALAGAAAALVAWPLVSVIAGWFGDTKLASLGQLAVGGAALVAVYVGVGYLLRVAELRAVTDRLVGRIRPSRS
ncbi:MAG: murein biosynthesis integral membrane protein MurJ [Micromonosporaceae bacterium]